MARPFSPARHFDLIGRVVRRNTRLVNHAESDTDVKNFKATAKQAQSVANYIKAGQFAQCIAYMKKNPALIDQLPETFETLQNQIELQKSQKAA